MLKYLLALGSLQLAAGTKTLDQAEASSKKGKCPFGYTSSSESQNIQLELKDVRFPDQLYPKGRWKTKKMKKSQYEDIVHEIIMKYESVDATVEDNKNDRAEFVGCLLRQAGHDFMDYRPDKKKWAIGGPDGCMDYEDPDNKGLPECLHRFGIPEVYEKWKWKVSLADFMVIIAEAAIGRSATDNYHIDYDRDNYFREGTFAKTMRDSFKYGRNTKRRCWWAKGRMPNPEHGCDGRGEDKPGLSQIFNDNIWKGHKDGWTLTAAISGAHTVGSAKLHNSGYEGFWSDPKNSGVFNNDYYWSLIFKGWGPKRSVNGNPEKNQWQRVDLGAGDAHEQIMLTTDMCLGYRNNRKYNDCNFGEWRNDFWSGGWVQSHWECGVNFFDQSTDLDPQAVNCCAWTKLVALTGMDLVNIVTKGVTNFCGMDGLWKKGMPFIKEFPGASQPQELTCCATLGDKKEDIQDCDHRYWPTGPAWEDIIDFMRDENLWLKHFLRAWHIATENGKDENLTFLDPDLGTHRNDPTPDEEIDCFGRDISTGQYKCTWTPFKTDACHIAVLEEYQNMMYQYGVHCFNRHRLVSAQVREYQEQLQLSVIKPWMVQWRGLVYMENPTMSSTYDKYSADRVLHRQKGQMARFDQEYFAKAERPYDWGVHAHMVDNEWTQSSCAITASNNADDKVQFWKADFVGGDKTIKRVIVTLPPDINRKAHVDNLPIPNSLWTTKISTMEGYEGIKVYIGDQLCGTLDNSMIIDQYPEIGIQSGEFNLDCAEPLTGGSVTVKRDGRLIICDVIPLTEYPGWTSPEWRKNAAKREQFRGH